MSLRRKTLLIIGIILIGLVAVLYVLSQTILLNSYAQLEADNTQRNVERALNAISDQMKTLGASDSDYAWWDDTYNFVVDRNSDYMTTNFINPIFTNLEINLLVIVDDKNEVVAQKAVDLDTGEDMPIPDGLDKYLTPDSPLLNHPDLQSNVSGVILLPDSPMLISSQSILTSNLTGPSHGSFIFGLFLNQSLIGTMSDSLKLPITIYPLNSDPLPAEVENARQRITTDVPIYTTPVDSDYIAGYGLVNDISGKPAALVEVNLTRDIYHQGQYSISLFLITLIVVGLVFAALTVLLLEQTVISRLRTLGSAMETISRGGDLSARLDVSGSDELSRLGKDVNQMLSALETTQLKLHGNDMQLRTVVKVAPIMLWSTDSRGRITLLEGKNLDLLGLSPDASVGKVIAEVFSEIPHLVQEIRKALNGEEFSSTLPVSQYVFDAHYVPLRKPDGTLNGMIGVATDITERMKAEAALQEASQNITQKNQQLEYTRNLFRSAVRHMSESVQRGATSTELMEYLEFLQNQPHQSG
jgi:PAS domain S-box-containing protein